MCENIAKIERCHLRHSGQRPGQLQEPSQRWIGHHRRIRERSHRDT